MGSPASNGRAYQDGIISRRDMPRVVSEYLPAASEGFDDEVGNRGRVRARPRGSGGFPIGESFNGASLSKIVSYVRSYMRRGVSVFEGWGEGGGGGRV